MSSSRRTVLWKSRKSARGTEGRSFLSHVLLLLSVCDIVVSGDQNMPRTARKIGGSNIFHVMLRGINRQDIFEDDEDRLQFMSILCRCKEISGFRLHAFVLRRRQKACLCGNQKKTRTACMQMLSGRVGTKKTVPPSPQSLTIWNTSLTNAADTG